MILLINSPVFREKVKNMDEDILPPHGLGYIATNLESRGLNVSLIDAFSLNLTIAEIQLIISKEQPNFIGLNVFTTNLSIVKKIVESCETNTNFIIGGPVTKHIYHEILDWVTTNNIDIVIGEADFIVADIVLDDLKEKPITKNKNRRVFLVNSSSVYFPKNISAIPLNRRFFINEPYRNHYGFFETTIITSRGCIHDCAFCGAARSLNKENPVREMSLDNIKKEIINLKSLHPEISSIRILDDLFLKNRISIVNACLLFKNIGLIWRSMAHITSFNGVSESEMFDLRAAGCNELFIGIESGSVRILKMINKTSNTDQIKETVTRLLAVGLNIKGYFVFGFPKETEQDMAETYNLARELRERASDLGSRFRVSVFQFRPYHGTALYNRIKETQVNPQEVVMNTRLSEFIGRNQFNFSSGNYSLCSEEILLKYIKLTNDLNNI